VARGLLLVALAAVSWGTTGTVLRLAGAEGATQALLVGALRMAIAGPVLLGALLASRTAWKVDGRAVALAGVCMAAYQLCYFSAVPLAGVAVTALLAICSAPILVACLARLALNEALTGRRLAALALGVAGAGLLLSGSGAQAGPRFGPGAALALGAGLSYSIYVVITKRALARSGPLATAACTFGAAAVALAPLLAIRWPEAAGLLLHAGPLLLYLGVAATAAAYWLYTLGLRAAPAGAAVIVGLLEPLVASLLGVGLFHESMGPAGAAGAVLLAASTVLLAAGAARAA
jgi:DME family drug/metabolite transporter